MRSAQNESPPIKLPSAAMQEVYNYVEQFALTKAPILITGETGVGKEIIAREIHRTSSRRSRPFIVINCSAVPENGLLNSEIFGHEKGAFTGATHQRKGVFEQADTGTLFLDEIGDMDVDVQPKFLRLLDQQEFTRLGGNRIIKTDVRIIAATNQNLKLGGKNNRFRRDIYYRLNLCEIPIPPLREHREDILPLVDAFLTEFNTEYKKNVLKISSEVRNFLKYADWPGNIRQLQNIIERAVILTKTDEITFSDLPADVVVASQIETFERPSEASAESGIPAEVRRMLAQISVTEFILIFGGIPNAIWRMLPEKTQSSVIREASFHLLALLGGHEGAIWINGMDKNQILGKVAQRRIKEHGSLAQAAKSLGIDRRTLKSYTQTDDISD
ncbi:hypothetical protein C6503_20625 [Candidatus Poribacteria bacterium]|nr:MAG: hypothetical protein C6503_20625 [Candidatus Poribacteria bacterium]